MGTKVMYEWDLETAATVDSDTAYAGDVLDHDHSDTFPGFNQPEESGERVVTVLVRDVFDDCDGLIDRSWAYLSDDGKLPERFHQMDYNERVGSFQRLCEKVPQRFHKEVERYSKRVSVAK